MKPWACSTCDDVANLPEKLKNHKAASERQRRHGKRVSERGHTTLHSACLQLTARAHAAVGTCCDADTADPPLSARAGARLTQSAAHGARCAGGGRCRLQSGLQFLTEHCEALRLLIWCRCSTGNVHFAFLHACLQHARLSAHTFPVDVLNRPARDNISRLRLNEGTCSE